MSLIGDLEQSANECFEMETLHKSEQLFFSLQGLEFYIKNQKAYKVSKADGPKSQTRDKAFRFGCFLKGNATSKKVFSGMLCR